MKKVASVSFLTIVLILSLRCLAMGNDSYPDLDVGNDNMRQIAEFMTEIRPYRNYLNVASLNKVAEHIKKKFEEYGLETEEQRFEVGGTIYKNVIATAGHSVGRRIIVGAHYDVCGDQPGADDNAGAVAGLLEIARLLKQHEKKLNYRVDFVAYSLEEPPFFATENMGSYVHAKKMNDEKVMLRGMICLEMIGYFTDEENSQEYPHPSMKLVYPSVGDFIGVVGNFGSYSLLSEVKKHMKKAEIGVRMLSAPAAIPGVDFSDHRSYWQFGYKAIMITDTAFYRNPNYHTRADTIKTLDFDKMKEVVKGVCWTVLNIK